MGATSEEIIDIATNFLLNAPPGEYMEVVTDVRSLLPNESMINESAPRTFREYNTEQMIQVDSPKGHKVLITKYGEVADGDYVDPKGGVVLHFDHIKQEVTGSRPISGGDLEKNIESLRSAFEAEAFTYVNEHYPHGTTTVYGKDGKIIVAISSARFNPHNFWNGRWRSVWTFHGGELVGHFKIVVHYYEDGNVQLNTDTTQTLRIDAKGNDAAVAKEALKAITKSEQQFQEALDQSYRTMGDTTFKALRRALPITRQRIDWNKIKNYKIGGQMGK